MEEIEKDLEETNLKVMTNIYFEHNNAGIEITNDFETNSYYLKIEIEDNEYEIVNLVATKEELEDLVLQINTLLKYSNKNV